MLNDAQKVSWINERKHKIRKYLQIYGTEYRRSKNENYWAEQGAKFIDVRGPEVNIVSDDARFNNEGDVMKERGFKIIQIDRPGIEAMDHASEKLEIVPHARIINDGTISDLHHEVDAILRMLPKWV